MEQECYEHDACWSRTPHYRPGARLTAEQLNVSQADAVRRDRLVNVAMHGIGVAYGFNVLTDEDGCMVVRDGRIHVSCGLAFDKYGRMLFWRGGLIGIDDLVGCKPDCVGHHTLSIHYAEKSDDRGKFNPCRDGTDWVDRCVAFTLKRYCMKHDCCAPEVPSGVCMTRKDWVCARNGFEPGNVAMDEALADACVDIPPLAASDCGRVAYDPDAGIALSCIEICDLDREKEDCPSRYGFCPGGEVDSCSVRPVAYRNRLLYELANQDDVALAKIHTYSWSGWELQTWSDDDRVYFSDFANRVKACQAKWPDPASGFSVMFTRPIERRTLHPLSVIMDIFILETRANYWEPWRIPAQILHLDKDGRIITDEQEKHAWGAMICPENDWIKYEIDDPKSTIRDCANEGRLARVEVTVRGQLVRDWCGLMIDARPPDIDKDDPCGNRAGQAMAGGDFRSVFRISKDRVDYGHDTPPAYRDAAKDDDKSNAAR